MRIPRIPRIPLRRLAAPIAVILAAGSLSLTGAGTSSAATSVTFTTTAANVGSTACMDDPNASTTAGTQLIQWSCNSGTNQNWTFTPVAGTTAAYSISNGASSLCVDVSARSTADNAQIIQYTCNGQTNQQFTLQAVTVSGKSNTFNLVAGHSGKCIVPSADATASNTALVQLPCTTAGTRVWQLATPPTKTVRVFWLKPTDVAYDQAYPDGIASVMREAQRFYKQQLGKTFTLNSTVVETVNGLHDTNWYITNNCDPNGDHYWCVVANMQAELQQRFGLGNPDSRWLIVGEVSAEEVGQSGGGGSPGWVLLSGHDADGAAGKSGDMNRWYGGMVHELGHAFGLPDAASTDGTCMSASLYDYPNCSFNQTQKDGILNGPYGSFLS